jgi:hypothetical protein
MTARFVARRNYNRAAVRNPFDLAFENPEFAWINQIVGGINCQKRGLDFFQVRPGVVVM